MSSEQGNDLIVKDRNVFIRANSPWHWFEARNIIDESGSEFWILKGFFVEHLLAAFR